MKILLNTRLRRKLLAYSFMHSDQSYYVRELAGFIGEDPGNLSRELKRLENEGLYTSSVRGRAKFYNLNKRYPLFRELKAIVSKSEGIEAALKEIIAREKGIRIAFIYGSYAKGDENAGSDIDLVVAGTFDRDAFTEQLRRLENRLDREINFNAYKQDEFDKEVKKRGGFLYLITREKIILLKGSLNDR